MRLSILCFALLSAALPAVGDPARPLPEEGEHLYERVPDVLVKDARGEVFRLAERWQERPLILTMVFASCVQICPPYLRSLAAAVEATGRVGEEYDVLVLSFDPRDTPESMANLAELHGLDAAPGWTFGVSSPDEVDRLAETIGFWSEWDERYSQFDHPAMLAGIDDGRVVRLLVGADVPRKRLTEVLWELRRKFVPTYPLPSANVIFRCFSVDPGSGAVALDWGALLLLAPGLAMFAGAFLIFGRRSDRGIGEG